MEWNDPKVEWTPLVAFLMPGYKRKKYQISIYIYIYINIQIIDVYVNKKTKKHKQINTKQSLIQKTPASNIWKCYCFDIHSYNKHHFQKEAMVQNKENFLANITSLPPSSLEVCDVCSRCVC